MDKSSEGRLTRQGIWCGFEGQGVWEGSLSREDYSEAWPTKKQDQALAHSDPSEEFLGSEGSVSKKPHNEI